METRAGVRAEAGETSREVRRGAETVWCKGVSLTVQVIWCASAVEVESQSEVMADQKGECNSACQSDWSPVEDWLRHGRQVGQSKGFPLQPCDIVPDMHLLILGFISYIRYSVY